MQQTAGFQLCFRSGRESDSSLLTRYGRLMIMLLLLLGNGTYALADAVVGGIADLRSWDYKQPVRLSGEWEFYWQRHLAPRQIALSSDIQPSLMNVPDTWNGKVVGGNELPETGFATYRINVLVSSVEEYALKIPDIGTAYELFVDGKSLAKVGEPGQSRKTTTPRYYPTTVSFTPQSLRVEIVVHVSNYDYRMGGIWLPLVFGTPQQIESATENQRALDLLLFGAIVIIGLYNLALFAMRREDPSSLFLGLFCLLLATRLMTVGDRYLTRVLDLPFEWFVRVEYLSWILALSAFAAFMRSIVPQEFVKQMSVPIHAAVLLATLIVLLSDVTFFSHIVPPLQLFTIAALIGGSFAFGLAIFRRRQGALILTFAYTVLFYATVNDILVNAAIIDTFLMLDMGLLVFIFFQSMLISYRFTRSFKLIEMQRAALEAANLRLQTQEKLRRQAEDESTQLQRRIAASERMEVIETLSGHQGSHQCLCRHGW